MTFDEYTADRRRKKLGIDVDDEAITLFTSRQPTACPACGAQVFDPFVMGVVIHDVARCAEKPPNAELTGLLGGPTRSEKE